MTKKEFIKKYNIDETSVYPYKKRFPEIFVNGSINYKRLDEIIQEREAIKQKVKEILKDKKPIDIEFLFSGQNKKSMSHGFIYQLHEERKQILVRDSNYKKYLQIIEHFKGDEVK